METKTMIVIKYQPEAAPAHPYDVQLWQRGGGYGWHYCGNGRFFQSIDDAREYAADYSRHYRAGIVETDAAGMQAGLFYQLLECA